MGIALLFTFIFMLVNSFVYKGRVYLIEKITHAMYWYAQATEFPCSSEYLANISAIMSHHFPSETGVKLRTVLVALCQNVLMQVIMEPDSEDSGNLKKHGKAGGQVSIYAGLKP
jgi:hypothetical protein